MVNKQSVLTGFNPCRLGDQYYSKNFYQYNKLQDYLINKISDDRITDIN